MITSSKLSQLVEGSNPPWLTCNPPPLPGGLRHYANFYHSLHSMTVNPCGTAVFRSLLGVH